MKNSPQNNHYRWIWIYAAVIVLLAGVINIFMWLPIPTFGSLSETSWLGFWGSYLGGAPGCLPAIAALIEGRQQAKREHKEREKDRHFSHMPVFDCEMEYISDFSSDTFTLSDIKSIMMITASGCRFIWDPLHFPDIYDRTDLFGSFPLYVRLKNVGLGPAMNAKVSIFGQRPFSIGQFPVGKEFAFMVILDSSSNNSLAGDLTATISFEDVFEWCYTQKQPFIKKSEGVTCLPIFSPQLQEVQEDI